MKRLHVAILAGQALSFALIIIFIFANQKFDLIESISGTNTDVSLQTARISACLVGIVGVMSIWLTWHYSSKSYRMKEMLVVCAWTHRVKSNGEWITFDKFLSQQHGYAVSHGLSDSKKLELQKEIEEGCGRPISDSDSNNSTDSELLQTKLGEGLALSKPKNLSQNLECRH